MELTAAKRRFLYFRLPTTSSRTFMCATGWIAIGPANAWTT